MYSIAEAEAVANTFKDLKAKFSANKLQSTQILQLSKIIFELTTQIDIRSKVNLRRCLGSFRTSKNVDLQLTAYTLANLLLDNLLEKNSLNQNAVNDYCERNLAKNDTGRQLALEGELLASEEMFLNSLETELCDLPIEEIKLKVSKITTSNDKLIRRFARSTNYLIHKIEQKNVSQHDKQIATAALKYLAEDFDIIPDEEGLIGLVDDMHVIRLAIELIDSSYSAVEHIADSTIELIKSFQDVFISDGKIKGQISDYLAVSLHPPIAEIKYGRDIDYQFRTNFVEDHIKFTTVLISLCMWQREGELTEFENLADQVFLSHDRFFISEAQDIGQFVEKVTIGGEIGYMFETLQLGKIEQRSKQFVPISALHGFFPASKQSNDRKKITSLKDKHSPVKFLKSLNKSESCLLPFATHSKLFVITTQKNFEDLLADWTLNGWRFGDILPTSFLSKELELVCSKKNLDPNFCKIVCVHDPDLMAEKCMIDPDFVGVNDIVIVNSERFKNKTASLKSLKTLFKSKIFIGDFMNELASAEGISFEWPKDVLNAMSDISDASLPSELERKVYHFNNISFKLHQVGRHEIVEQLFDTFNQIKRDSYLLEQEDQINFQSAFKYFLSNSLKFWESADHAELLIFCKKIANLLAYYDGLFDLKISEDLKDATFLNKLFVENNFQKQKSLVANRFLDSNVAVKDLQELRNHILADEHYNVTELDLMFWPGRKQFKKLLQKCEKLKTVNLFLFDHEKIWFESYSRPSNFSIRPSEQQARLFKNRTQEVNVPERFKGDDPEILGNDFEAVPCILKILFEDGFIYANNQTEFILSQKLIDKSASYHLVTSEAVCAGDPIVFIAPATRDELAEAQQAEKYNYNLTKARSWQNRLRSIYFNQRLDFENFVERCRINGLVRHPATLSNWVFDREIIAPRDYRTSLPLLNEIFGLSFSTHELKEIFSAIKVCHADQHISGQQIAKDVRNRLISGSYTETDRRKIYERPITEIQFVNEPPNDALIGIFKKY